LRLLSGFVWLLVWNIQATEKIRSVPVNPNRLLNIVAGDFVACGFKTRRKRFFYLSEPISQTANVLLNRPWEKV
jgi:hypothetical protein